MIINFDRRRPHKHLNARPGLLERLAFGGGETREAGALSRGLWARGGPAFGLRVPERWAGVGRFPWLALPALSEQVSTRSTFAFFPLGRATADFKELYSFFKDHRQAGRRFGILAAWDAPSAGVSVACWLDDAQSNAVRESQYQTRWAMDAFKRVGCENLMSQTARGPEALIASIARSWEFAKGLSHPVALDETLCTARAFLDISAGIDRARLEQLVSQDCRDASSPARYMELIDTWLLARTLNVLLPETELPKPRASRRL